MSLIAPTKKCPITAIMAQGMSKPAVSFTTEIMPDGSDSRVGTATKDRRQEDLVCLCAKLLRCLKWGGRSLPATPEDEVGGNVEENQIVAVDVVGK